MAWAVVAVAVLIAIDVAIRMSVVRVVLHIFETKPPFHVLPAPPVNTAERVAFVTRDGLTLRGSLYFPPEREPRGLIVFCPELEGSHWSAMSYCEGLWSAGFAIFSFDFRSQGDSDLQPGYEPLHWLTAYEVEDVISALAYVRQREDLRKLPVGILGISRGGGAALVAAALTPEIECVVCEGTYSTDTLMYYFTLRWANLYLPEWLIRLVPRWHILLTFRIVRFLSEWKRGVRYVRLERYLRRLRGRRVQLISGARDNYVPKTIPEELCRRMGSGCRPLVVVPKAKHNAARVVDPEGYDRVLLDVFGELQKAEPRAARIPS